VQVGLFGKLPSHGDFLRRRTSDAFVEVWDGWLQECVALTRARFGDRWLDMYLTSPAWRFVCAPGVCGPDAVIGVMVPSVDRVGRYFPLTLVAELPGQHNVVYAAASAAPFFQSAEQLVIETLEAERVDFESFDARVSSLRTQLAALSMASMPTLDSSTTAILDTKGVGAWQVPISSPANLTSVFLQLFAHRLASTYEPVVLWWTEGSEKVEPSFLIGKGLPSPESFGAFLDGSWKEHRWQSAAKSARPRPAATDLPASTTNLRYKSAAASDVGRKRSVNQDAFLERAEIGLWAVADGLGGHKDGDIASRMVCDTLSDFEPAPDFDTTVDAVRERLEAVNDHLLRASAQSLLGDRCGSTVVVLLVRHRDLAILWAGDSRVYRLRASKLQQMTQDHSASMSPVGLQQSNIVTRAIGVAANLEVDVCRDTLNAGDRFLLCSDGLTRTVSDFQIQALMEHKDPAAAVQALIKTSLDAGAPDNVTAVMVEIQSDTDTDGRGSPNLGPSIL
jgi:type VI secretion system protein ImpM